MKLHSDTLTAADLHNALNASLGGAVYLSVARQGSRSRAQGYTFRLEALRGIGRRRNSGIHGAEQTYAATWDEHGAFFARVFEMDPHAIIGPYDGRDDFHRQTEGVYALDVTTTKG